jgi:hypothetical protein
MKLLIRILSIIFTILSFVVLNYLTIPYLDNLDHNSNFDFVLAIIIVLLHVLVPVTFLFFGIFKGIIDEGKL